MKQNGFTLIEMLIAVVVVCIIVVIALPMYAVRAKKSDRIYAKAQLMTIKESQDRYKMEHGAYTADTAKLTDWKAGTKKYRFQVDYADTSSFTAHAHGDMDKDRIYDDDVWSIDQKCGAITQIK